jgi:hypothetical protein
MTYKGTRYRIVDLSDAPYNGTSPAYGDDLASRQTGKRSRGKVRCNRRAPLTYTYATSVTDGNGNEVSIARKGKGRTGKGRTVAAQPTRAQRDLALVPANVIGADYSG